MMNSFMPAMIILSGSITPGRTGSYNHGYEEGSVLYDPEGNPYFFEDGTWFDSDGNPYGPNPDPSWKPDEP